MTRREEIIAAACEVEIKRLTKERDLALANADAVYDKLMPEVERLTVDNNQFQEANHFYRDGLATSEKEIERLRAALNEIEAWSRSYPLKVFPEPDWAKVRELLGAGGITVDAVSAGNMRHAIEGVGKIAREALANEQRTLHSENSSEK